MLTYRDILLQTHMYRQEMQVCMCSYRYRHAQFLKSIFTTWFFLEKKSSYHSSVLNTWLQFAVYFSMLPRYTKNNDNTNIETHKRELNGLLVGGIRDNKGSHKWSKNKRIRRHEGKKNGGARRAEEAEAGSHRVVGEQRRLWEVWCKGLDLSNGNRLATQRGQLPLSRSLPLLSPLSGRGGTGGGLKCKRGRGSETGGKWEEQRAEWGKDEAEMVPVPVLEQGRDSVCARVWLCACWRVPACACVHSCLWAGLKRQCVDYC